MIIQQLLFPDIILQCIMIIYKDKMQQILIEEHILQLLMAQRLMKNHVLKENIQLWTCIQQHWQL